VADRELEEVLRIAREASALVSAVYATPFTVEMKGPGDPVTRADREANELICRALEAAFPGDAIVAEESVPADPAAVAALVRKPRVFYVDPLDGTREFADRNGEFSVMIGLSTGGRADLGVLVMPTTGEALAGRIGRDGAAGVAFLEDGSGARRPLAVSPLADPSRATLVVSRSHRPRIVAPFAAALGIQRIVPCGSVGVKVARVVTGEADLYVHGGGGAKRWDTCGPEAVLVAAGGRFTDLAGREVDYASADLEQRGGILASNGALHEAALRTVAAVRAAER
jgi:3'(2'), 5'-bisphosphate nucleotidase